LLKEFTNTPAGGGAGLIYVLHLEDAAAGGRLLAQRVRGLAVVLFCKATVSASIRNAVSLGLQTDCHPGQSSAHQIELRREGVLLGAALPRVPEEGVRAPRQQERGQVLLEHRQRGRARALEREHHRAALRLRTFGAELADGGRAVLFRHQQRGACMI